MLSESILFEMALWVGSAFVGLGFVLYIFPSKRINNFYGYRTAKSMENQERWTMAQKYSAKVLILLGVMYSILVILLSIFNISNHAQLGIGLCSLILMLPSILLIVEKKLDNMVK